MCSKNTRCILVMIGLLAMAVPKTLADVCPSGATATGLGWVLTAYRSNSVSHALEPIGTGQVGACETIFLQATATYVPTDINNNTVAAFSDGGMSVSRENNTFFANITPPGGVPKIGPQPSDCSPPAVADRLGSGIAAYTITAADVVSGTITFFARYTNGTAHLSAADLVGGESATTVIDIHVNAAP